MDFAFDPRTHEISEQLWAFMRERVFPAEAVLESQLAAADAPSPGEPAVLAELKSEARSLGLWNLFLPDIEWGAGLTNLQYAPLAEITG